MGTWTLADARAAGYTIERGAYTGTTDDRADRWYAYRMDTYHAVDHRGAGYGTRAEAIEAAEYRHAQAAAARGESGEEIGQIRARLDLTQKEFAGRIGVDRVSVSRWETGERAPGEPTLRLARTLTK